MLFPPQFVEHLFGYGLERLKDAGSNWSDGFNWTKVADDGFGDPESPLYASAMATFMGQLFVGGGTWTSQSAKVWRSTDGTTWERSNEDGFGNLNNAQVMSLAVFNGDLYAGTYNGYMGCEIWRLNGPLFADGFESGDTTAWSATVQ